MKSNFEQSDQYEPKVIAEEIDETLAELDALLFEDRFQSEEEKNTYLRKLYGLLAASNNNRVREMIHYIESEYSK